MSKNRKFISLAGHNPELVSEWHPIKNGDLKPDSVSVHSGLKVWWLCSKGHEWQAVIGNRTNGTGCPVCAGKVVLEGFNDLASARPDIAKEWNYSKNEDLLPTQVTLNSGKKVWWLCSRGHEWQSIIANRVKGNGCPTCSGEMKTSFPEQVIYFYLKQITTAYNRYKIDARTEIDIYLPEYKLGIEYDGIYFHDNEKSQKRETEKENKLKKQNISLVRVKENKNYLDDIESDNIIYIKPAPNERNLAEMIEKLLMRINSIYNTNLSVEVNVKRDRSEIYEQFVAGEKENSLLFLKPDIASEWHPTKNGKLLPESVSVSSNKRVWWQCQNGHEWQAVINSRSSGYGCPYCAGQKVISGYNDLATINPNLAKQWHPTKNGDVLPSDVAPHSNLKYWWICEKGHEWETNVSHRTRGGGCPICSGHKVLEGYNDLVTINPQLASQWHPTKNGMLTPRNVTGGCDKKVWWMCEKGHEWEATISSRQGGRDCPYCAGQRIIVGFNDLQTLNPKLANQWHPTKNGLLTPSNVMPNSNKKAWWLGECGHEWEAVISSRNRGNGCPYCASQKLLVGFNDLATKNPVLASQWHPTKNGELTPKDVLPGSNKQIWWMCEKGHEWQNVVNVRNGGNGCPYCANQKVWVGYNDLATLNPELAKQWHPTKNGDKKPSDFTPGANKKAWWICEKGHEWEAFISSRKKGHGCQECYRLRQKNKV